MEIRIKRTTKIVTRFPEDPMQLRIGGRPYPQRAVHTDTLQFRNNDEDGWKDVPIEVFSDD